MSDDLAAFLNLKGFSIDGESLCNVIPQWFLVSLMEADRLLNRAESLHKPFATSRPRYGDTATPRLSRFAFGVPTTRWDRVLLRCFEP
jgi:hypothetical protein